MSADQSNVPVTALNQITHSLIGPLPIVGNHSVVSLQQVASIYQHGGDSLLLQKLRTIEKSTYQQ